VTDRKPKVVYWNDQPSPYLVARLNAVADRGNLDIEAWFNEIRGSDRSWDVVADAWRFNARLLTRRRIGGYNVQVPVGELRQTRPDLLISLYDRPRLVVGLLAARVQADRVAVRCLPPSEAWSTPRLYSKAATGFVFRMLDYAKCSGCDACRYATSRGLPAERMQVVTQSIDVEVYRRALSIPEDERVAVRNRLGLKGCVFVYVGRIWQGKGLDTLLAAYRQVRAASTVPTTLLMVGDGVDEERYRQQTAALPDVVWAGFVQTTDLPMMYGVSDVFVFPTLGDPHGLVIDEAMAAGLPVITSDAAGDVEQRVEAGVTGYVVRARDADSTARRMRELAADPIARAAMARNASTRSDSLGLDRYAADFEAFVEQALALPKRRTVSAMAATAAGHALRMLPGSSRTANRELASQGARPSRAVGYDTDQDGE
jgi:glycosyltransferase involved in cell wall biosynthesis